MSASNRGDDAGYDIGLPDFRNAWRDHWRLASITLSVCLLLSMLAALLLPRNYLYFTVLRTGSELAPAVAGRLNEGVILDTLAQRVPDNDQQDRLKRHFTARAPQNDILVVEAQGSNENEELYISVLRQLSDQVLAEDKVLFDLHAAAVDMKLADSATNLEAWAAEEKQNALRKQIVEDEIKTIEGRLAANKTNDGPVKAGDDIGTTLFRDALSAATNYSDVTIDEKLGDARLLEAEAEAEVAKRQAYTKNEPAQREAWENTKRGITQAKILIPARKSSAATNVGTLGYLAIGLTGGLTLAFAETVFFAHAARRRRVAARSA